MQTELMPAANSLELTIRAETDIQIETAKKYPMHSTQHDIDVFLKKAIALATIDQETAKGCLYKLPVGGEDIEGPNVRLAEIVAVSWGNLRIAQRITEIGDEWASGQAVCHDLETNVAHTVDVRRRLVDKYGKRFKAQSVIINTAMTAAAIAGRNAVFKVVPLALCGKIYAAVKEKAVEGSIEERRANALREFSLLGVYEAAILEKLGKESVSDIDKEDVATLGGLYNAVKSRDVTVEDAFPPTGPKVQEVVDRIKKTAPPAEPKKPPPPKTTTAKKAKADPTPAKPKESAVESTVAAPAAGSSAMIHNDLFLEIGSKDRKLANHVWQQSVLKFGGPSVDDFLYDFKEHGANGDTSLRAMMAEYDKNGG